MWKLFQMFRIRFWRIFIVGLMAASASASIRGYADLNTIKNEHQFTSQESRLQQLQPHGQPLLKISSEVDMTSKKKQSANVMNVKEKQDQFSETNIRKSSENKPDQQNNSEQSLKLNQLEQKSQRSNSIEITQKVSQSLTNKKTGNNLRISQIQDSEQQPKNQSISQEISFVNSSNIKKERPKTFKANVKVASKLPSILNITHRKNKVDWINQHEMKNENNSLTNNKTETQNNDKGHTKHINKYNVAKEIEQISNHLSKPIQHISSTKFLYEFGFEYPMLSQDQNSKIFNQSIDQFSSPIQLSLGSAFQNRLKSQFVVLSKQIPSIQRHLKLKTGSYKIEFEWQSNAPNGELIVFWNHRIVGSYRSFDDLKKEETIHVESTQECFNGDNILKFKSVGPVQIGIDNIQVIN